MQLEAKILQATQTGEELEQSQEQVTSLMADIQALKLLRDKLNETNTQLAAQKLAVEGRLKVVEEEKSEVEESRQQVEQAKLSLEDEKTAIINTT